MQIGFVSTVNDPRSPITPETLLKYTKANINIIVESGLGKNLGFNFDQQKSRAEVFKESDIIFASKIENLEELNQMKKDAIVISFFEPFADVTIKEKLSKYSQQIFSLDMVPRTTLAQSMDVMSSMASVAGYKAVLLAALKLPKYFPMMMTAAGTVKPANVLIVGAGVAGLQAVATSRKLGAKVEVFDVRKAVKEEVQGLGAKFVEVEGSKDDSAAGGYAVEQSEEYLRKQKEEIAKSVAKADVVITTAQIRGKKAPMLITKEMIDQMKHGSVIIDMASCTGGNCELTRNGEEYFYNGINIIGNSFLHYDAALDSSMLYSTNIFNYIKTMVKDGELSLDMGNEILSSSIIAK